MQYPGEASEAPIHVFLFQQQMAGSVSYLSMCHVIWRVLPLPSRMCVPTCRFETKRSFRELQLLQVHWASSLFRNW